MQIAIALYPEFTSLDAMGPYQVLQYTPGAETFFVAETAGLVRDDHGELAVEVTRTFDQVRAPDVVVIPGGTITRTMAHEGHPLTEWIRSVHPTTTWTTSVCTGALMLGAAGLLRGLTATTHWQAVADLEAHGATYTEQRVVRQGRIITGAGVSAGIDMALTLLAEVAGDGVAQGVQLAIEYDPQPPFDSGAPSKADPALVEFIVAIGEEKQAEISGR